MQKTCGGGSPPVQNDIPTPECLSRTLASAECFFLFQLFLIPTGRAYILHLHTYTASYLLRLPSIRGRGWPGQDLASLGASWNTPQRSRLYAALSNRLPPRMPMVAGLMRMLVGLRIPALEQSNSIPG